MAQVWLRLEAIAQQHGVADALQALVRVSSINMTLFFPYQACNCACAQYHQGWMQQCKESMKPRRPKPDAQFCRLTGPVSTL